MRQFISTNEHFVLVWLLQHVKILINNNCVSHFYGLLHFKECIIHFVYVSGHPFMLAQFNLNLRYVKLYKTPG